MIGLMESANIYKLFREFKITTINSLIIWLEYWIKFELVSFITSMFVLFK